MGRDRRTDVLTEPSGDGIPRSLTGYCGHCRRTVDNHDAHHRVSSILHGGAGVECRLRGDLDAHDCRPLGRVWG